MGSCSDLRNGWTCRFAWRMERTWGRLGVLDGYRFGTGVRILGVLGWDLTWLGGGLDLSKVDVVSADYNNLE